MSANLANLTGLRAASGRVRRRHCEDQHAVEPMLAHHGVARGRVEGDTHIQRAVGHPGFDFDRGEFRHMQARLGQEHMLGGPCHSAGLGNGDEVAPMTRLHENPKYRSMASNDSRCSFHWIDWLRIP